jgi:phenylalanyl-tRNA synthetase beta chain
MKISYNWLKELSGLDWSVEEVADRLTLCGDAVEEIESTSEYLDKVVVGQVAALEPVPKADKIQLARVDTGWDTFQVICGAPNVAEGQKVAFAQIGARLKGGFEIKKAKIRGVESFGMICSQREMGISDDHSGIWVLPENAPLGLPLVDYLDFDDYTLTFEITPNRPDSLCAIGIARDLAALGGVEVVRPRFDLKEIDEPAEQHVSVAIDDPEACPRYAARIIRNITVGQSPWWVQKRIITAGMRPINNVVDITNLVMLECGHPLHAFDLERFGSNEVLVRRAQEGEEFTTLDEQKHKLTPDVLLITNGREAVAAGGVMGGLDSEVHENTKTILLEAAYFNPSVIRKSRRHLGLNTESSYRFERGADPNGIEYAINRAAQLFAELCGGDVCRGIVDCYPQPVHPKTVSFRPERCNQVLGTDYSADRMREIFESLEFAVEKSDPVQVTVPTFRPDIEREIDLIEEVVRIQGYASVPDAVENIGPLYTPAPEQEGFREGLRRLLTGIGFDEMYTSGLSNRKVAEWLHPGRPIAALANSLSAELDIMRNSLIPPGLDVVSHNLAHRSLNLRLFEIGKTYLPPSNGDGEPVEEEYLCLMVSGQTEQGWRQNPRELDFYDLTGALEVLQRHFRWPELEFSAADINYFESEQSFDLMLDGRKVGRIGRFKDQVLGRFDIKQPVCGLEVALEPLKAARAPLTQFRPLPQFPAVHRDLAVVVDEGVPAGNIIAAIHEAAGDLARSVEIFDLYTGKQIAAGKKSLAFAVTYRSDERSLESEEVDKRQEKVVAKLKQDFNAEIRDK